MIELYGSPKSSSGRSRWMIEEVGVPYEYKRVDVYRGGPSVDALREIYPPALVPVLRDGELLLVESIAINFYLAEKYRPELFASDVTERAQIYQWSLSAITNLQPHVLTIMFQAMKPGSDDTAAKAARVKVDGLLAQLDAALAGHEYLVADRFTVADVNAGSVVNIAFALDMLKDAHPNVLTWMQGLRSRPAFARALKE